jgi:hypothetical protein
LTATTSSGLPVYFDFLSGPATLDTNSVVTLLCAGTVTVSAWQPGSSNYNAAATVQCSFNVSKIPQTITFGALSQQEVGDVPFPLSATASSGLPVSLEILSGPATLSGNIVALAGWGTVVVHASQAGNATYAAAASVDQSFAVSPAKNTLVAQQRLSDGSFQIAFYGDIGSACVLQGSTNLVNWTPVLCFTCTNSPAVVVDTAGKNFTERFYRIAPLTSTPRPVLMFATPHPLTSSGLDFSLEGVPGLSYRVDVSTNLANWLPLTNFGCTNWIMFFRDGAATNYSRRFYRAVVP